MNVTQLLFEAAKPLGKKAALFENGRLMSYSELRERIDKLSAGFIKIGIKEDHRVALILPSGSEFICVFLSLLRINAIASPLSTDLTPFELHAILENLRPHAIIAVPKVIENFLLEYPLLLREEKLILHGNPSVKIKAKNCYELKGLYRETYLTGWPETQNRQVASINYTYRGLGYAHGAMISHDNYLSGTLAYIENTRMTSAHKVLSLLPLYHVYPLLGCMLAPFLAGATIVATHNFMPRSIFAVISDFKVNYFKAVPSIYALLLGQYREDMHDLSSLNCCITGGSYMTADLQEVIKSKMKLDVYQGYGLTECLPVTWNRYEYNKKGTLGLPLSPDFQIKIVGEGGAQKGQEEIGEIIVNSPTIMQGYYNHKAETAEVLRDGWLHTGDYGYLDESGYLHFAGLKKNIVKVGGNMVDIAEVVNVLLSHPQISNAMVSYKPDALWGHVLVAEVISRVPDGLTESDVKLFCGKYLSRFKIPRTIKFSHEVV